jgi:hypothetical protein
MLPLDKSRTRAGQGSSLTAATDRQKASIPWGRRAGPRPSAGALRFVVPVALFLFFLMRLPGPDCRGLTRQPNHWRSQTNRLARRGMMASKNTNEANPTKRKPFRGMCQMGRGGARTPRKTVLLLHRRGRLKRPVLPYVLSRGRFPTQVSWHRTSRPCVVKHATGKVSLSLRRPGIIGFLAAA